MERWVIVASVAAIILVAGGAFVFLNYMQTPTYTVTVTNLGNGKVLLGASGGYATTIQVSSGTKITLTAVPDLGYQFNGWVGDFASSVNPLTLTVDKDLKLNAVFIPS
jgi:hypothetical protein